MLLALLAQAAVAQPAARPVVAVDVSHLPRVPTPVLVFLTAYALVVLGVVVAVALTVVRTIWAQSARRPTRQ